MSTLNHDYTNIAIQAEFDRKLREGKKFRYMGQTVHSETWLFGRIYFWMEDGDGTLYLAKEKDGLPDFS